MTAQCVATRGRLDPTLPPKQCPRRATHGEWCRQHAESLGGWRLTPPAPATEGLRGYVDGMYHLTPTEYDRALTRACKVRAEARPPERLDTLRHLFDDEALPDLRPPFEVLDGRVWGDDGDEVDADAAAEVLNFVAKALGFGSLSAGGATKPQETDR